MKRPNLQLSVVHVNNNEEKCAYLFHKIPQLRGSGLLYTATRRDAEMVADFLKQNGIQAEYFHARLDTEIKHELQESLMKNEYKVICSTNALGMGIDKPDIRYIIHYHFPASPIHYYQEIGRAGRDGEPAECILLYCPSDKEIQDYFITYAKPEVKQYEYVLSLINESPLGLHDLLRKTGYPQASLKTILSELIGEELLEQDSKKKYRWTGKDKVIDTQSYEEVRQEKFKELQAMIDYANTDICLMYFLTSFLGDPLGFRCGKCGNCTGKEEIIPRDSETWERICEFQKWNLPPIDGRKNSHRRGLALAYHRNTEIGGIVRRCKYQTRSDFPDKVVNRAVEVIHHYSSIYPLDKIDLVTSIPPTESGPLVENFARRVAQRLGKPYQSIIKEVRQTGLQKTYTNWLQKQANVKGAFEVSSSGIVVDKGILIIDDIYDSGQTLKEVGKVLMNAEAAAVYPFTITRTLHSDV